ncbi:MAG: PhoH family protein [Provencibacterium sp.]|jgi:phosphate starvation-inducible PhoH-like protein|nr:PhoH family protein [Provencibacterium sp.]
MAERTIEIGSVEHALALFGQFDGNIRLLEREFGVSMVNRAEALKITGDEHSVELCSRTVTALLDALRRGETLSDQAVRYCIQMVREGSEKELEALGADCICITAKGRPLKPRTLGQKQYNDAISKNTVVFGVGPAGTGKTYLAVARAVRAYKDHEVSRIILTRPAVEAGEKLGFLPGDLQTKVDPYLRPLYDALFDMLGAEGFARLQERGNIEVAPLAYMRGRTLDDSFIILDEAQNTSSEQMKMFLTRLGANSKAVITGDITQIDLPEGKASGLVQAVKILKKVEDIAICYFTEKDVVRHRLVQDIIKAYERYHEEGKRYRP